MIVPVGGRYLVCATAAVLEPDDQLKAWLERHVRQDPDIRWIVGNYVEANEPNGNGHIFPLDELLEAQATLVGKPLNMGHREHYIVGYFPGAQLLHANGSEYHAGDQAVAAQMADMRKAWSKLSIDPAIPPSYITVPATTTTTSTAPTMANITFAQVTTQPPYVEAVAGMWHRRFPEEFFKIREAHGNGTLFFSMEAIPEEVSCPTCAHRSTFAGLDSDTYCEHMRGTVAPKILHKPTFNGGAVIIPPLRPGWSRADVTAIAKYIAETAEAEQVYDAVAAAAPHLDPRQWESTMAQVLVMAREFKPQTREKMAKKGTAMPDGSYPIANEKDLKNAIQAIGRAKDPAAAKAHIRKRAKALGLSDLIPDGW